MKYFAKNFLVLFFFLLYLNLHSAVAGGGGSGYSRYGLGDLRYFAGERSAGMGGVSIALLGTDFINRTNPASWTNLSRTRISGSFLYERFKTTDGLNSAFFGTGNFDGVMLTLPIAQEHGITFATGFNPYSSMNYNILVDQTVVDISSTNTYKGEGGLTSGLLGLSYRPSSEFHLGAAVNYLFGQTRNRVKIQFTNSSFFGSESERTTDLRGFNVTLGAIYTGLGKLIGVEGLNNLTVGAMVSTPANLRATQENTYHYITGDTTISTQDVHVHIPLRAGFGAAYQIEQKYLVAGDLLYENWENFRYFDVHPVEIRNSVRAALGFERLASKEQGAAYWERVSYRFGAYYLSSYYRIQGEPINETALTAGISLLIAADTRLVFAFSYGVRGTTDHQFQRDNIFRFSVSLSASEQWFVRAEEE